MKCQHIKKSGDPCEKNGSLIPHLGLYICGNCKRGKKYQPPDNTAPPPTSKVEGPVGVLPLDQVTLEKPKPKEKKKKEPKKGAFIDLDDLDLEFHIPDAKGEEGDEQIVEQGFNSIFPPSSDGESLDMEELEIEDDVRIEHPRKRREDDVLSRNFLKLGYMTCIGVLEANVPGHKLDGLSVTVDRNAMIAECLDELNQEYGDLIGLQDMDPASRLCICTGMLALQTYSANSSKKKVNQEPMAEEPVLPEGF